MAAPRARFVSARWSAHGGTRPWADVTADQLYTVFDIHPAFADEFVQRGATAPGLTWHYARPPVLGLDVEVDVRSVSRETVLW
jgi:hypothetical protein